MIFTKKLVKSAAFRYFLAGCFTLMVTILVQNFYLGQKSAEKSNARFFKALSKKEKRVQEFFSVFKNPHERFPGKVEGTNLEQFKNLYSDEGLALFLYQDDSLLFWSTNRITLWACFTARNDSFRMKRAKR